MFTSQLEFSLELTVAIQGLTVILAITSVVIAILSYHNSKQKNKVDIQTAEDRDLSEYAVTLLESAYKALRDPLINRP